MRQNQLIMLRPRRRNRRAFTLVEMLVAVALITILMTIFAQIFSLAAEIMSRQRGLALNDQSERNIQTIIRNDLDQRTFRRLIPFRPTISPTTEEKDRAGYFHIEEGAPQNDTDDILQFTVQRSEDLEPFYGRAWELNLAAYGGTDYPVGTPPGPGFNPNQPEFDDEILATNSVGSSRFSEVSYFLRNGTLYRRSMLIREPKVGTNPNPQSGNLGTGGNIFSADYPAARNLWEDFDYAAFYNGTAPQILGKDHLLNDLGVSPSFGLPQYRFGFDFADKIPRSTISNGAVTAFIGRFTQRETSDNRFRYPGQQVSTYGTPPLSAAAVLNLDPTTGVVTEFNAGKRYVDDVLLTNVHAFDIKVWEPGFVLGADNVPGSAGNDDGNTTADQPNSGIAPGDPLLADVYEFGASGTDDWLGPDGGPGVVTDGLPGGAGDDDGDGVDDNPEEIGWPGTDDADTGRFLDLGHGGVFPLLFGGPALGASYNTQFGNCFDTWHPDAVAGSTLDTTIPFNPIIYGPGPDGQPGIAGVDDDVANGPDDPGELGWAGSDDPGWRIPLRMIRIHIRYLEPKSEQMRDVIIVQSLTE